MYSRSNLDIFESWKDCGGSIIGVAMKDEGMVNEWGVRGEFSDHESGHGVDGFNEFNEHEECRFGVLVGTNRQGAFLS